MFFANPVGYVLYETPDSKWHAILIGVGPFILNTLLGALIAFPASLPFYKFDNAGPLDYVLIYLGISIAMHAFPSTGDAASIWAQIKDKDTSIWVKLFGYPIVGLIYLISLGSFFWLDLIYGVAIAVGVPYVVIALLVSFVAQNQVCIIVTERDTVNNAVVILQKEHGQSAACR